ncbi:hypothetical protein GCM10027168_45770 [Streptomyces capparidis]
MLSLSSHLTPLALGALLAWTGAVKLFGRSAERQVAGTALERAAGDLGRAARALRALGAVELAVAAALLAVPPGGGPGVVPGTAAALLGAGFLGYLGYARATVPGSSCGCSARDDAPVGPRAFARAGLVPLGGLAALASDTPWWRALPERPGASLGFLAACLLVAAALFADVRRRVLPPLGRLRIRLFGHPLGDGPAARAGAPVEATVELLERSLAWEAAAPVVRSGLLDHWDEDGWRFLQYSGLHRGPDGQRHVLVVFAVDARADLDNTPRPAVRVVVLDEEGEHPLPDVLADVSARPSLPIVT